MGSPNIGPQAPNVSNHPLKPPLRVVFVSPDDDALTGPVRETLRKQLEPLGVKIIQHGEQDAEQIAAHAAKKHSFILHVPPHEGSSLRSKVDMHLQRQGKETLNGNYRGHRNVAVDIQELERAVANESTTMRIRRNMGIVWGKMHSLMKQLNTHLV